MKKACLFLLAGLYAAQLSSFASHSDLFPPLLFALIGAVIASHARLVVFFAAGLAGLLVAAASDIDKRLDARFAGDSIMARVVVADFPQRRGRTVSFMARVADNPWVPERVRVAWFNPPDDIGIGETWQLELRLQRPRGTRNPGVFDYEAWLFRERIAAVGYVAEGPRNRRLQAAALDGIDHLRLLTVQRIRASGVAADQAAVLAAISVGARHLVTREQWDQFAASGTSHLMAISGLHVGIVAAAGYFLTLIVAGVLRMRGHHLRMASLVAMALAAVYALLSGLGVPAQRSLLMLVLAAVAVLCTREVRPFHVIATTCIVVVAISPIATLTPGFKLSFSAVVILLWIARRRLAVSHGVTRGAVAVWRLTGVQLSLLFGLLPLTALVFGRVSLLAPIVNLIAVPVFSFVTVPLMFLGLGLTGSVRQLGDWLLHCAGWSLGVVDAVIDMALQVPLASVRVADLTGASMLLSLTTLAWVLLPPGWPGRGLAWLGLLAVVMYVPQRPPAGCVRVDVLDVGQGLAVLATTRASVLLYDTGPAYRNGGSAAESVLRPFLAARRISHLDHLVISHGDLDHAGGIGALRQAVSIGRILTGEALAGAPQALPCHRGRAWRVDQVHFEFQYPSGISDVSGNNASCVLRISAGGHSVLLTGDIEGEAEAELLQNTRLQPADVVVVPHHGSRTSSGRALVGALRPTLAIVSAAHGNRWDLPDAEVRARWRDAGAEWLTTAEDGAISVSLCEQGGLSGVTRWRHRLRRIWHE